MAYKSMLRKGQRGAALVEFSITLMTYLLLILGIIEFALIIFDAIRLAEGTRVGVRYAIVSDPACDVLDKGTGTSCASYGGPLNCSDGPTSFTITVDECDLSDTSSQCNMVREMNKLMLRDADNEDAYAASSILAGDGEVDITYSCTEVGDPQAPYGVPAITVAARDVQHPLLFFGTSFSITLPDFSTTRTAEDLHSE